MPCFLFMLMRVQRCIGQAPSILGSRVVKQNAAADKRTWVLTFGTQGDNRSCMASLDAQCKLQSIGVLHLLVACLLPHLQVENVKSTELAM